MSDYFNLEMGKSIKSLTGKWYQVIQFLGTGGNAVTFLVLSTSGPFKGVMFAAKVFRKLSAPQRRERFLGEVQFLTSAEHPSIMRVFDTGVYKQEDGDYPFVIAEYLPTTLSISMKRRNIDVPTKLSYAMQLVSALRYLANLDPAVVHRDIKPQNIFIKGNSCVLGDFGLMKLLDNSRTDDRTVYKESIGPGVPFFYRTPDLISYAQNKSDVDCKSDVFQLGLVLSELLTGWNPLKPAKKHLDPIELKPLGDIKSQQIGGWVASILHDMLSTKPDERPSADDVYMRWQKAFLISAKAANKLNGRVL